MRLLHLLPRLSFSPKEHLMERFQHLRVAVE